ncbi:hypothetical protein H9P43_007556 [Blastocladiella emersonii ATCC 22665]|nr:hypothetical protein H9P43_007556 [Blastocladiella emersonii ATCC 22665]
MQCGLRGLATKASKARKLPDGMRPVIGLEFHAQIASRTKLFSPMTTDYFGRPANTAVEPFDVALPGSLPVLQRGPMALALATGIALGCTIPAWSKFERKHYYYADLPSGYQITQRTHPLAVNGELVLDQFDGLAAPCRVGIEQVQLEQDTGKSMHEDGATFIDYNRAGMALMEIVTRPDMTTPIEAATLVKSLQSLLRTLATCSANLEEGSLRMDVNVSVKWTDARRAINGVAASERVELKNIATISGLTQALEYEIDRLSTLLAAGHTGARATRGFDAAAGKTFPLRSKETARDYRFVADADLPRLVIAPADVERVKSVLPLLPAANRAAVAAAFPALSTSQIRWLTDVCPMNSAAVDPDVQRQRYLDALTGSDDAPTASTTTAAANDNDDQPWTGSATAAEYLAAMRPPTPAHVVTFYQWLANDLTGRVAKLRESATLPADAPLPCHGWGVTPAQLASIPLAMERGVISGKAGKLVLDAMLASGDARRLAPEIADANGWTLISDPGQLTAWAEAAMKASPRKAGIAEAKYATWLVGQIIARSKGRANPQVAQEIGSKLIAQSSSSSE